MNYGKLTESIYKRSVVNVVKANGAGLGTVCAALPYIGGQASAHGTDKEVARRAFHAAVNRAALQCGLVSCDKAEDIFHSAESVCANLTLSVPQRLREIKVRQIIEQAAKAAAELSIPFANIDVQVLPCVTEPVVSCVVEVCCMQRMENRAKEGEDIVMTKWLGLEGTAVIADRHFEKLLGRYPMDMLDKARRFGQYCSILPEAATAMKSNAGALSVVREGGIFGGLWALAAESGVGLTVDLKSIPIKQETVEICTYFDCNPYELLAGGSLLITINNGWELVRTLHSQGIAAAVIGKITEGNDRIIQNEEEMRFLESSVQDALYSYNDAFRQCI